ncbi:MAG: hypothetical protein WDZ91_01675 [Paenibacillaceae bacterium]
MHVQVQDHRWDFNNTSSAVDELIQRMELLLEDNPYYVSHMVIDGIEVYEDYREYLLDHLTDTLDIHIAMVTVEEMANEILLSTQSYLDRAIPEILIVINEFYQGPTSESWDKFAQLLEGIQWIQQMIQSMDIIEEASLEWGQFVSISQKLDEITMDMQEAVENKDAVEIGDNLKYELMPQLEVLTEQLQHISKVVNKHAN